MLLKWWGAPSSSCARPPQGHRPGEMRACATRPCPPLRVPVSLGHQRLSCLGPSVPHTDFPGSWGSLQDTPQRSPHHPQDWSPDHMTFSPPKPAWTLIGPFGHPGAGWSEKTHREGRGEGPLASPQPRGLWGPFFEVHRVTVFFQTKAWREGWPHVARVPTPLCGPWTQTSSPAHRSWAAGLRGSDGEGDEAVVALDVPLEDLGAGAQHTLKAGPVQLDTLEGPSGHHGGRPGPVQQQRNLPWGARGWSGARPPGLPALLRSTGFQQAPPGSTDTQFPIHLPRPRPRRGLGG